MQRERLLAIALVALVALAGCSTGPGGGGSAESGTMTVYLSDQPGAIEDFEHLNVTVTSVGVHMVNDSSDGESGNESGEWIEANVSGTYDLTELRGENATALGALELPNATYDNVFVYVSEVNGTLADGSHPDVKLPSSRLHVQKNFTVGAGEETHFVFDVMVHETGNGKYVLRPNVGESGAEKPVTETDARATRGGQSDSSAPENRSGQGNVVTYVSDQPAAIDDFRHLNATVTEVGLHRAGGANGSTNTSAWQTVTVNETVDLTELRGANATPIVEQSVPNGTYDNVFVYVGDLNGTLEDGSHPAVKLPSSKLHLSTEFTVGSGESVDFVFDLAVHETGNGRYMVKPNAGESGPDQPIERVNGSDDPEEATTTTSNTTTTTTTSNTTTTTTSNTTTTTTASGNASA